MPGVSKAALCRAGSRDADIFASGSRVHNADNSSQRRNHLAASGVERAYQLAAVAAVYSRGLNMNKARIAAAQLPAGLPVRLLFAAAAVLLALACVPQATHAQGIVRGAQEGSYEGNRIAGPVGGAVGGVVGAGVGGAVGAVDGILGIPYRGHRRCRGYYDGYHHFRCY
jgi:hypothetical protein